MPLNFVVVLVDTAQAIDLRFAASLQRRREREPAAFVVATGAARPSGGPPSGAGAAAGAETYSASDVASAVPA